MRVVLDSSIMCRDFQTSGSPFRVLFDGLAPAGHSLYIPRIVIDEVQNKYAEELVKIDRFVAKTQRVIGREIESPLAHATIEERREEYRQVLESRFAEVGATIVDYPDVPHEVVVQRALGRRKPFSNSGKGYRDALIWDNVIDLASSPGQDIAFISGNKRDFFDNEGNLHPDLLADIHERGIQPGRIAPFSGLGKFVDEHIKPTMEALEDIRQQLADARYPGLDLAEEIAVRLPFTDVGREWDPVELGFPWEFESPTISLAEEVQNIQVLDVRELYSGEFLIRAEAEAYCEFEVFVFKADYYAMADEEAPYIWDHDWNRHYFAASTSTSVHIEVEMTFDPNMARVTSMQLLYMGKEPEQRLDQGVEQLSIF